MNMMLEELGEDMDAVGTLYHIGKQKVGVRGIYGHADGHVLYYIV